MVDLISRPGIHGDVPVISHAQYGSCLWNSSTVAMTGPWLCHSTAMAVSWQSHGSSPAVPWQHHGTATCHCCTAYWPWRSWNIPDNLQTPSLNPHSKNGCKLSQNYTQDTSGAQKTRIHQKCCCLKLKVPPDHREVFWWLPECPELPCTPTSLHDNKWVTPEEHCFIFFSLTGIHDIVPVNSQAQYVICLCIPSNGYSVALPRKCDDSAMAVPWRGQ